MAPVSGDTVHYHSQLLLAIQNSGPHAGAAGTKNYPGMFTWGQRQEAHLSPGVGYQPRQCVETIKKEKEEKDYQVAYAQVKLFRFSLVQGQQIGTVSLAWFRSPW